MDIQKEREAFESWWEGFHNGRQIACDYIEEDNSYSVGYANAQWVAWQAKAQAVPEGFILVPKEPTEAMIQRGTKANSECLNENAPLGERLFRHPTLQVYQAMVNGSGE